MADTPNPKNTLQNSNLSAGGNIHIGDITYNIAQDFQQGSILFLRIDKTEAAGYTANLSIKSKHSTKGQLATEGVNLCENIALTIATDLLEALAKFQTFRRTIDNQFRNKSLVSKFNNHSIQATENALAQQLYQTFFAGEIGEKCKQFIQYLEEQRLEELLLAISTEDEEIINLPFEMVLPLLFPAKLATTKNSLAITNFGLVRTKIASLAAFQMEGK